MTRLFVYGTLMPGQARWPVLEPFTDLRMTNRTATVSGRLWDTGWGWPAMTAGERTVPGVVVALVPASTEEAIARLDEIEGVASGLFTREVIDTSVEPACTAYLWPGATDGFTELHGGWERRCMSSVARP